MKCFIYCANHQKDKDTLLEVKIFYCYSKRDILLLQSFKNLIEASFGLQERRLCSIYIWALHVFYCGVNDVLGKSVEGVLNCLNKAAYCTKLFFPEVEIFRFFLCI